MEPKLTAQQQIVLSYLEKGRTLTNTVALTCLGVGSLSSRIAELRKLGYDIADSYEEHALTGRLFKKYNIGATTTDVEHPDVPISEGPDA